MANQYDKYVKELDFSNLPDAAKPVMIALGQFQSGDKIDQVCPDCHSKILVDPKSTTPNGLPSAWFVSCKCGECNCVFRGL